MEVKLSYFSIAAIFVFSLFILFLSSVSGQTAVNTYQSPLFGFQFDYPADWPQISEVSNGVGFIFEEPDAGGIALNAVTVVVIDLTEPTTLQKFLREYLSGTSGVKYDTLLVNQTEITTDKFPAVKAEYDAGAGGISFGKSIVYVTIKDDIAYVILYTFGDNVFQKHMEGFQTMINSFKIT